MRISHNRSFKNVKEEDIVIKEEKGEKKGKRKLKGEKSSSKKQKLASEYLPNPLDQTNIHPESYEIARRYICGFTNSVFSACAFMLRKR